MKIEWKEWWRHVEGEVLCQRGFHMPHNDPDWWYFNIDPETQSEQIDDDDPDRVHEDDLFENESDARAEAHEWLVNAQKELNEKVARLKHDENKEGKEKA